MGERRKKDLQPRVLIRTRFELGLSQRDGSLIARLVKAKAGECR